MTFKLEIKKENVGVARNWLAHRGGIAVWHSINLSNPGALWLSPARLESGEPSPKPNWQVANEPVIVTSADDVGVYTETLFKAFAVTVKIVDLSVMLTDAAQRKVDKALASCREKHGNAHYRVGVLEGPAPSVGIYYGTDPVPLSQYGGT